MRPAESISKKGILLVLFLITGLNFGCGSLNRASERPSDSEANAEKERNELRARCNKEKDSLNLLNSKAEEFGHLTRKTQLTSEPYLKGKLFIVDERDKRLYAYDFTPTGCRYSKDCQRDAGCSPTSVDQFQEVRARSIEEVQTVALIACRKIKKGDYTRTSGPKQGETIPGYDLNCDVTLSDQTIPAVIFRKTFNSELLMIENETALALTGTKELVARTPYREIDAFLLGLPRRKSKSKGVENEEQYFAGRRLFPICRLADDEVCGEWKCQSKSRRIDLYASHPDEQTCVPARHD